MLQKFDRYSNKIQWMLLLLAIGSFFIQNINLGLVLFLYFLVEMVRERESISSYFNKLSFKGYVFHVLSFFGLIAILTPITMLSLRFLNTMGVPTWGMYVYLFFLLNISIYLYVSWLDKRQSKNE